MKKNRRLFRVLAVLAAAAAHEIDGRGIVEAVQHLPPERRQRQPRHQRNGGEGDVDAHDPREQGEALQPQYRIERQKQHGDRADEADAFQQACGGLAAGALFFAVHHGRSGEADRGGKPR